MVTDGFAADSVGVCYLGPTGLITKYTWIHMDMDGYDFWMYTDPNGYVVINDWEIIGTVWYYFGEYGNMYADGTYEIDGEYYTFDEDGKWIG